MFDWEALKQPSQPWDQLLPCLWSRKEITEYTNQDKGQSVLFALPYQINPLLYGSWFFFFRCSSASSKKQGTTKKHSLINLSCLFIEHDIKTHRDAHTLTEARSHTLRSICNPYLRQANTPGASLSRSFHRSVIIPGQEHLTRMTNLYSARCPGWLRLPCRFYFRRDSVIVEASYDWNGDKSHKGET